MKRYVSGVVTGGLVGALLTGVWLLKRPRSSMYRMAFRQARHMAPTAFKVARRGGRLVHMAKRRLG